MNPLAALVPIPLCMFACALVIRRSGALTRASAALMVLQTMVVLYVWGGVSTTHVTHGFQVDPSGAFFVILTTLVFTAALLHAVVFFDAEGETGVQGLYAFLSLFLLSMYGVVTADNLGYLWISMEASTLLSAPLVYHHRSRTALEATWKYLIICSVGIAFAFFGTAVLYGVSQQIPALGGGSLSIARLTRHAHDFSGPLVRFAFVLMLLGYGTKAGLFPLHSWLPDAHSEAPAPVSAILSGALLNCALVALWRVSGLMQAAGQGAFVWATLAPMALATIACASLFLLKQRDLKRLLAYSSMENVGLMALAIALRAETAFGQQALNHSAAKVALFLLAGTLLQETGTKRIGKIHGLLETRPVQAALLLLGVLAVAGTPPFGSFLAEWSLLSVAIDGRHPFAAGIVLTSLALAFVALSMHVCTMLLGPGKRPVGTSLRTAAVPAALIAAALALGLLAAPACLMLGGMP